MIAIWMDRFVEFATTWLWLVLLATWRALPILILVTGSAEGDAAESIVSLESKGIDRVMSATAGMANRSVYHCDAPRIAHRHPARRPLRSLHAIRLQAGMPNDDECLLSQPVQLRFHLPRCRVHDGFPLLLAGSLDRRRQAVLSATPNRAAGPPEVLADATASRERPPSRQGMKIFGSYCFCDSISAYLAAVSIA
jgi:hypothetical protein